MRMNRVGWLWVVVPMGLPTLGCSSGLIEVVADGRDASVDAKTSVKTDGKAGADGKADADAKANADGRVDPICNLAATCTPGSYCVLKAVGPCGADERLECSEDGAYFFDVFPCVPESCDGIDDGPDSCQESCTCEDGGMACHGSCPDNGRYTNCSAGVCAVTLVTGSISLAALAADATELYWADFSDGRVVKVPLAGGAPTTLSAGRGAASGLAIDDAWVYWTAGGTGFPGNVLRTPKAGGAVTTLVSGLISAGAIAVDATNVYAIGQSKVIQVPRGGGTVTTLVDRYGIDPTGIAVNSTDVFWPTLNGGPDSGIDSASILRVPIGGGTVTTIVAFGGELFSNLAATDTHVYFGDDGIHSVPTSGGLVTTLATGKGENAFEVAIDGTSVYWASSDPKGPPAVESVSLTGGNVFTLAASQAALGGLTGGSSHIAVNATAVFFATGSGGVTRILEITPK